MDNWKNPDIIFSLAKICYIRRERDAQTTDLLEQKCKESEAFQEAWNESREEYRLIGEIV